MKISFNANALLCAAAPALLYHTKDDYGSLDFLDFHGLYSADRGRFREKKYADLYIKDCKKIVEYKTHKAYFNLKKRYKGML